MKQRKNNLSSVVKVIIWVWYIHFPYYQWSLIDGTSLSNCTVAFPLFFFFLKGYCSGIYRTVRCHVCKKHPRKDTFVKTCSSWSSLAESSLLVAPSGGICTHKNWKVFKSSMIVMWKEREKKKWKRKRKVLLCQQFPRPIGSIRV